jgi:uncharacterized membrane protein
MKLMLNPKTIGVIAGLVLGLIVIFVGFWKAVVVALFILAGWFIGKVWMGEIDLQDLYERFIKGRGRGSRR